MPIELRLLTLLESQGIPFGSPGPPAPLFQNSVEASAVYGPGFPTTLTYSRTISALSNQALVVIVGFNHRADRAASEVVSGHIERVTFNGIDLIRCGRGGSDGDSKIEYWHLLSPPQVTANVVVTIRTLVGTGSPQGSLLSSAWEIVDVNQTLPFGRIVGERGSTATALVNVPGNLSELIAGACLGGAGFDMIVGSEQIEQFDITQPNAFDPDPAPPRLAGSTEAGMPCVPTSWSDPVPGSLWVVGGLPVLPLTTVRTAPTIHYQEDFETGFIVGNDLGGQGGWVKLFANPSGILVIDGGSKIDKSNSIKLLDNPGGSGDPVYYKSVTAFTAATDTRIFRFEFEVDYNTSNGTGTFMHWKKTAPTGAGDLFTDVALYLTLQNNFNGGVTIRLDNNLIGGPVVTNATSLGTPHTLEVEFSPPNIVKVRVDNRDIASFTTTAGQEDWDTFIASFGNHASADDSRWWLDSFNYFTPGIGGVCP